MLNITNTSQLTVGDTVLASAMADDARHEFTVSRVYTDSSISSANSRTVTLSLGPGRYSFEVRNDTVKQHSLTKVDGSPRQTHCDACNAKPGEPCTSPTNTGRRSVNWYHTTREDATR